MPHISREEHGQGREIYVSFPWTWIDLYKCLTQCKVADMTLCHWGYILKGNVAPPWLSFSACLLVEPTHHIVRKPRSQGKAMCGYCHWQTAAARPPPLPAPTSRHVNKGAFCWFQPTASSSAEDPDIVEQRGEAPDWILDLQNPWEIVN